MKNSVNFAFYFFVFSRTAQKTNVTNYLETQNEGRRYTFKTLVRLLYFNFMAPILICLLFVEELTTVPL